MNGFPLVHYLLGIDGLRAECANPNTNKPQLSHCPKTQFWFWVYIAPPIPSKDTAPEFQAMRWITHPRALLIWATHAGQAGYEHIPKRKSETKMRGKTAQSHCMQPLFKPLEAGQE